MEFSEFLKMLLFFKKSSIILKENPICILRLRIINVGIAAAHLLIIFQVVSVWMPFIFVLCGYLSEKDEKFVPFVI